MFSNYQNYYFTFIEIFTSVLMSTNLFSPPAIYPSRFMLCYGLEDLNLLSNLQFIVYFFKLLRDCSKGPRNNLYLHHLHILHNFQFPRKVQLFSCVSSSSTLSLGFAVIWKSIIWQVLKLKSGLLTGFTYFTQCKFCTLALFDGLSLQSVWQQVLWGLQNYFQYSGRSQQCSSLDRFHTS